MEKMNAVNLEKMYEVLKFVEYGGYCRRSMDCVHGMLLIDRMKNEAVVDKAVLFGWFRKMAVCAEQYERCGEGQNYKYLNPYGIVLSDEGDAEKSCQKSFYQTGIRNGYLRQQRA